MEYKKPCTLSYLSILENKLFLVSILDLHLIISKSELCKFQNYCNEH